MSKPKPRVILNTNLLISRALTPSSLTASAVRLIVDHCELLVSQATMDEFVNTLMRIQSKGYVKQKEALLLITGYKEMVEWVPIIEKVQECRDPKGNKFLELAVNGNAGVDKTALRTEVRPYYIEKNNISGTASKNLENELGVIVNFTDGTDPFTFYTRVPRDVKDSVPPISKTGYGN